MFIRYDIVIPSSTWACGHVDLSLQSYKTYTLDHICALIVFIFPISYYIMHTGCVKISLN